MSCCNPQRYNKAFGYQRAQKELADYRKSGLKASSQPLMELLKDLPLEGKSLLDIGGGIGSLTLELLKRPIRSAMLVDFSSASVAAFHSEVERQAVGDRVNSRIGDFMDLAGQIPAADLVVLDKVICCYPDFRGLVSRSITKAGQWYVYSIPRDKWWIRLYFLLESLPDRISGRYIPLHFHSHLQIEQIVFRHGFRKRSEKLNGRWRLLVFCKQ